MQKAKNITAWVLQFLLGASFTLAGAAKFWAPIWPRLFAEWGYPAHFHLLIGGLEVLGGLALLFPQTAGFSAAGLMVIMVGAAATLLTHGGKGWITPAVNLVLLAVIVAVRLRWNQATAAENHKISTA